MSSEGGAPAPKVAPSDAIAASIQQNIDAAFTDGDIGKQVVDVFVGRENGRRVKLLVEGYDKLAELNKAHIAINKSDIENFDSAEPDAKPNKSFSAKRKQEIQASAKKLKKIKDALDGALLGNFEGLEKALKGGGDKGKPGTEDED